MMEDTSQNPFDADIAVPGMPPIPGLRLRRLAGPGDYAAIAQLRQACTLEDRGDELVTEAEIAVYVETPVDSGPYRDLFLAHVGDSLVAMHWSTARIVDGTLVAGLRGYVHPAWRRRGFGRALLAHGEAHARAHVAPEDAVLPGTWQTEASSLEAGAQVLYRTSGYIPVRYASSMTRSLAEPIPSLPIPSPLEIRPVRPEHLRAIWEAERVAFQDAWGYSAWPEVNYLRFLRFPHYDPSLWRVAWDADQVAGMVLSYVNVDENVAFGRSRGYTEDIAVRRPWRRRGLASALLAESLRALQACGLSEAALGVDAENSNHALALYERLGFRIASEWITYRRSWPAGEPTSSLPEGARP